VTGPVVVAAAVALVLALVGNSLPATPPPDAALAQALRLDDRPALDRLVLAVRRGQRRAGALVLVLALVALGLAFVEPSASLAVSVLTLLVLGAVVALVVLRREGPAPLRRT
jgi:hypothetical protein